MIQYFIGIVSGIIVCVVAVNGGDTYQKRATELIKECEQTLPRNEHCTLVALPISKD